MDFTDRLATWKIEFGGDFKSSKASLSNTYLLVVSTISAQKHVETADKGPKRGKNHLCGHSKDFFIVVDGNLRVDMLNHIVGTVCASGTPSLFSNDHISLMPYFLLDGSGATPPPVLFLGDTCLTPWGGFLKPTHTLDEVYKHVSEFTSLGYILARMNRIRPRVDRDWTFLQTIQRTIKIEAAFLPFSDFESKPAIRPQLPSLDDEIIVRQ